MSPAIAKNDCNDLRHEPGNEHLPGERQTHHAQIAERIVQPFRNRGRSRKCKERTQHKEGGMRQRKAQRAE